MTSSSLLPRESVCLSNSDTSDSSTGDPNRLNQSQSALSQIDDTVSITVQKTSPTQKSGLSLVERKKHVYVTDVPANSLFHGTELQVGDKILLVNGKRTKPVEGARHVRRLIAKAKATVTMVVKRSNRKPQRGAVSLSPLAQRKKRRAGKNSRSVVQPTENQINDPRLILNLDSEARPETTTTTSSKGDLTNEKPRPQIIITANKITPDQNIGLQFKDVDKMITVHSIATDSIFNNTGLEIGDRIITVMGVDCKSNVSSQRAMELANKSQIEVTLVIEKTKTNLDTTKNGEIIQDKGLLGMSQHSERHSSPSRKMLSENSSSEDENHANTKGRSDDMDVTASDTTKKTKVNPEPRKVRRLKVVGPPKNTTTKTNQKPPKEPNNDENTSRVRRLSSRGDNDSEVSSLGEIATEEQKAKTSQENSALSKSPVERKRNSTSNHGKSLPFDYEQFSGDYIKVTVQKESETRSGLLFEKFDGNIVLAAVPQHEKRIFPGMQVLAINGISNIQSISKAEELVSCTSIEVRLVINFSSPLKASFKCPCCLRQLTADGKHAHNVQNRKIIRRKLPAQPPNSPNPAPTSTQPHQSNPDTEMMSVAASEITTKVTNKAPPGKRIPPRIERPPKYQFDEFDSDSDEDGRK